MPLYEYRCQDCDHGFELLVRESTTFECPACHGQKLEKQLSVFAVSAPGAGARAGRAPMAAGSCGSCGHPGGPGSCSVN
jgi:putative FmdB family regulatory protein